MGEEKSQCHLFGDFGIMVQVILGGVSFMVLVLKRVLEHPKRSWRIWALAFSALVAHFLNLTLAVLLSQQNANDACVWYFINSILDTTVGVIFCYLALKLVEKIAEHYGGEYVSAEAKIDYRIWSIQFFTWGGIVAVSKVILFGLQSIHPATLESVGDKLLSWITNPDVELVVVMVFVPIIMNMIQDNFLKGNATAQNNSAAATGDAKIKEGELPRAEPKPAVEIEMRDVNLNMTQDEAPKGSEKDANFKGEEGCDNRKM